MGVYLDINVEEVVPPNSTIAYISILIDIKVFLDLKNFRKGKEATFLFEKYKKNTQY